ncbi:hypothetical protein Tco_1199683 [Tanacetum coccineum]
MQGTSLTKQERECKLYDEFDKFTYKKDAPCQAFKNQERHRLKGESLTSIENTKTNLTSNIVSNKRVLHSIGNSKKHDNSDYVCINGDDCMSSDDLCVSNSMNDVKFRAKSLRRKNLRKRFGNQQEKCSLRWDIFGDLPVGPSLL